MSNLELNHVYKMYPNGVKAVNDFTMEVSDKEFIVFVGPSGCGKSTTLRMIAGLEEITSGDIKIDGVIVNDIEPRERDIAMVFQNYALYPHMTVYKNMAFGLKLRHMPKNEIDDRVREAAEILGITEYLNRKPKAMSGGQRQRVALGRAIVREPKIFLLDEPLSNLDAKLRAQMRTEISKLHHKLQTTFIYVTHDQVEAMTMGTRIVVMKDGFVQQIDSPRNLYRYPVNKFVAGFIGTPQMNFFKGILKRNENGIEVTIKSTDIKINVPVEYFARVNPKYFDGEHEVYLGLRCEHISIDPNKYPFKAQCRVSHVEELGIDSQIFADFNLTSTQLVNDESDTKVIIKAPTGTAFETDEVIEVSLGLNHLKLFDVKTEETINPRFPSVVDTTCLSDGNHIILFESKLDLPAAIKIFGGTYNVSIPTSAISFGSTITCKVLSTDETNDGTIYVLENNGSYLYMKDSEKAKYQKDDEVKIDVDLKQCLFVKNEDRFEPLNLKNEVVAEVIKNNVKVPHVNQKGQNVMINEAYCTLKINGVQFETNKDLGFKLLSLKEKKIFKDVVKLQYSPYDVSFAEEGIDCEVLEILDYGKELFAKARLSGGEEAIILIKEPVELGPNHIVINVNNVHAYHVKNDIRLA